MALKTWKPFITVVSLQFGYAGLSIIAKFALNQGMSPHVLASYRHIVATIFIAPFAYFLDRYSMSIWNIKLYNGHACMYAFTYTYVLVETCVYVFFTQNMLIFFF